jgi:hypothetical protein
MGGIANLQENWVDLKEITGDIVRKLPGKHAT